MSDATVQIGELADRLRAVPKAIDDAMPKLVEVVRGYMRECYARGQSPDGDPWPVTERGRKPDLEGVSLRVTAYGHHIVVRVSGHEAMHTRGTARGSKVRRMVPRGPIPPELERRMREVIDDAVRKAVAA